MIAAWMLYSSALGLILAGAALLAERLAERAGLQTRRVWAVGLGAAFALPLLAVFLKDAPATIEVNGVMRAVSPTAGLLMNGVESLAALDRGLAIVWALLSGLFALALFGGLARSWSRQRRWSEATVDGVPVLLTDDVGPAVVGFLRSRIVLPRWALGADPTERLMMLRHEEEHLAAGDPRLVLLSALLIVLLPWNAAVWYMAHRLRLAIEVDCDRRVVRTAGLDLRSYAELLVSVGSRRSVGAHGVGFSLGRPYLEQRIDRMTLERRVRPLRTVFGLLAISTLLASAWALPQPVRGAGESHGGHAACTIDATRALLGSVDVSPST